MDIQTIKLFFKKMAHCCKVNVPHQCNSTQENKINYLQKLHFKYRNLKSA